MEKNKVEFTSGQKVFQFALYESLGAIESDCSLQIYMFLRKSALRLCVVTAARS
jgi:hypothetical protein